MSVDKQALIAALKRNGGNITAAARELDITRHTARYAIDVADIDVEAIRRGVEAEREALAPKPEAQPEEIVRLETEVRRLRRKSAKRERVWKAMADQADMTSRIIDAVEPHIAGIELPAVKAPEIQTTDKSPITLMLAWSDIHWGKEFSSNVMHGLNAYGPEIAARRIQHVVDIVGEWKQNYEMQGRPVERLVILCAGDLANGNLHPEDESNYGEIMVQALDVSLVLSQAVWEMSHWFPKIDIVAPAGDNHTRLTKKSATSAKAFGTCVNTMLMNNIALMTRGLEHVSTHIDLSHQTYFNIYGRTLGAVHGNMLRGGGGQLGIPAYGMRRHHDGSIAETVMIAKQKMIDLSLDDKMSDGERLEVLQGALEGIVDYSFVAHFHTRQVLEFTTGSLYVLPSAMGTDPYANDALRKPGSTARQMLFAFHPRHRIIGEHTIYLDQFKDPEETSRYNWGVERQGIGNSASLMDEWLA